MPRGGNGTHGPPAPAGWGSGTEGCRVRPLRGIQTRWGGGRPPNPRNMVRRLLALSARCAYAWASPLQWPEVGPGFFLFFFFYWNSPKSHPTSPSFGAPAVSAGRQRCPKAPVGPPGTQAAVCTDGSRVTALSSWSRRTTSLLCPVCRTNYFTC